MGIFHTAVLALKYCFPSWATWLHVLMSGTFVVLKQRICCSIARNEMGNTVGALEDLDRALELEPKYAWALAMRGELK